MHCMTVSLAQNGRELAKIFPTVIKPSLTRGVHRFANSPSGECRKAESSTLALGTAAGVGARVALQPYLILDPGNSILSLAESLVV